MKKILLILLALALVATTACTSGEGADTADTTDTATETDPPAPTEPPYTLEEAEDITQKHRGVAQDAFAACAPCPAEELTFEVTDGGVCITGYKGNDVTVVIPSEINGAQVVKIADGAFKSLTTLRALCIPDTVTSVGFGAFDGCAGLVTLKLPYSAAIYEIHNKDGEKNSDGFFGYIFGAEDYKLNAAKIPFKLETVIFTGDGDTVPTGAFYDCNDVKAVTLPPVSEIGDLAFALCSSLEYVDIGNSVSKVGKLAFNECTSLVELNIPASTKAIGLGAIQGCGSLTSLTLPFVGGSEDENTYLGYIFGAESYTMSGGFFPISLQKITLLEGCKSIGNNAFNGFLTLREIIIPEGVVSIGLRAFRNCKGLKAISLPDSLVSIGDSAFIGCESLTEVRFGKSLAQMGMQAFMHCASLTGVSLPDSLTKIPASAFDSCTALKSVSLGKGVTEIGKNAFRGCDSITDLPTIPENAAVMDGNTAITK